MLGLADLGGRPLATQLQLCQQGILLIPLALPGGPRLCTPSPTLPGDPSPHHQPLLPYQGALALTLPTGPGPHHQASSHLHLIYLQAGGGSM